MTIKIIGTSHISPQSVKEIKSKITEFKPDCVAVELDRNRYDAMKRGDKINRGTIKIIGIRGYLLAKFMSYIQQYLGKKTGVMPGEEMLTAINAARDSGSDVALIDQRIDITLNKLQRIPFWEKLRLFLSVFSWKKVEIDLNKVPEDKLIDQMINELKKKSPTMYKVLISERDLYMAKQLIALEQRYENILGVVGAGHKKGITKNYNKMKIMIQKSIQ